MNKNFGEEARVKVAILSAKSTDRAKLVTIALLAFRNAKTGRCDPSEKLLAEVLGKSDRTVRRALSEAIDAGLISAERRFNRSNTYFINDSVPDTSGNRTGHVGSSDEDTSGRNESPARTDQVFVPDSICPTNSLEQSKREQSKENSLEHSETTNCFPTNDPAHEREDKLDRAWLDGMESIRKSRRDAARDDNGIYWVRPKAGNDKSQNGIERRFDVFRKVILVGGDQLSWPWKLIAEDVYERGDFLTDDPTEMDDYVNLLVETYASEPNYSEL